MTAIFRLPVGQVAAKRAVGLASVVLVHAVAIHALTGCLAQRVVAVPPPPLMATIIDAIEPPPAAPPRPVAKIAPPRPQPRLAQTPPAASAVTAEAPVAQPPAPAPDAAPVRAEPVRVAPVIDAAHSCRPPQYPAASRRNGEAGTVVVAFLIETDGTVAESRVASSSGFERLDEAARAALSLCRFKPGTVDGRPERSSARIQYVWTLN